MSSIDIVFLVFLAFFVILGIWKGFFREIFGFLGVVCGIYFGIILFSPASELLRKFIPGLPAALWPFISFVFVFIGVYLLSRIAGGVLSKIVESMYLGWLNRFLGGVLGLIKGALLLSLVLFLLGFLPFQNTLENARQKSHLYTPLQMIIPFIYNLGSGFSSADQFNFEDKVTKTLHSGQEAVTEEMIKYFYYGKKDSTNTSR